MILEAEESLWGNGMSTNKIEAKHTLMSSTFGSAWSESNWVLPNYSGARERYLLFTGAGFIPSLITLQQGSVGKSEQHFKGNSSGSAQ
jgi:hypothetical protein